MVVDAMVFAYALLGVEPHREEAVRFLGGLSEILVPDSLRAELTNVLWQWVLHRGVPRATAVDVLRDAEALFTEVVSSEHLWERALELAVSHRHPAYDTLFIALAEQRGTTVGTFDKALAARFPANVQLL